MAENKIKKILINSSFAVASNLISLLVSTIVVLVLPKLIGVSSYGYWQLYLFYTSYVGFFHLGWIDGIYLKYGGMYYDDLEQDNFYSQFISYFAFQSIIALIVYFYGILFINSIDKQFIFSMLALTLVLTNLRFFVIYILQTTNRIKESSIITIFDRIVYAFLLVAIILLGSKNYKIMIYSDIIARIISLFYGVYICRDILLKTLNHYKFDFLEIKDNIKIGSNLMISNVASLLIIGSIRLGIERVWSIETFGKVSLSLSISNLIMTFINAVGIVIFPMLKRINKDRLSSLYNSLRNILMITVLSFLILYFPIKIILLQWLPNYKESLDYMTLIFPMAVFETKMSLLLNTYLKALRMEKYILRVNLITVFMSIILTIITTIIFKSLILAVLSIVILIALRCILAEILISKVINIYVKKDMILEVTMTVIFIISGYFFSLTLAFTCYAISLIIYVLIKKGEVKQSFVYLKNLAKQR